ncbi:MAG: hypothetical protein GQ564_22550 [Bacteroidales bacterium]|nr:hypothetical protein [Bacteroidales bacterium]
MNIRDGTSQNNRSSYLNDDNFFHIDELTFPELISYAKDLAKKIKYYNLNDQASECWDELLVADEIVVMSEIIVLDIKEIEKEFLDNTKNNFEDPDEYLNRQIDLVLKLAEYVNSWYVQLNTIDAYYSNGLIKEIAELIREKLSDKFQICRELQLRLDTQDSNSEGIKKFSHFNAIWLNENNKLKVENSFKSIKKIKTLLDKTFYAFYNSINFLKQAVISDLDESLKNQVHSPYLSLFFTFIKLFIKVKERLNSFPANYFQFYYNDILKIKPKDYTPDSTYLIFSLKEGVNDFFIPKGTRFIGGNDESKKILYYSTDNDIVINKAKIAQLHTLYLEQNELIWPICDCTNLLIDDISIQYPEEYKPGSNAKWPLLGGPISKHGKMAELGFAISDNNFLVNEGHREIELELSFTEKSFKAFSRQLERIKGDYLVSEVFIKLFSNIFCVHLTIDDGWFVVDNYIIDCSLINDSIRDNSIKIQFSLSVDDPSVAVYNKDIHGYNLGADYPVAKFIINNESYLFPYSLIDDLELERITSIVNVHNLKNILIYNELGRIDTTKPFNPFGVIPKVNSSFVLGNYEMSKKKITNLDLHIKWNDLPENENGLQEYFNEYEENLSKSDYKCKISFLNNGSWLPEDKNSQEVVNLFQANDLLQQGAKEKLRDFTSFKNIETRYFQKDARKIDALNYNYDNNTLGGFIKISLSNPPFAFGHKKYPVFLTKITMENAKGKEQKQLPNPPFSPLIESITLGYTSISIIEFSGRQKNKEYSKKPFYHLHPWGFEDMLGDTQHKNRNLIPSYADQGNLFIGLKDANPGMTISIFFNLLDDSILEVETDPPLINWEYLTSNRWRKIPKSNLISDSTNHFLESGIVTLKIPKDIDMQNTILSDDYHWIKVSAKDGLEALCSLISISTQAVKVTWENQGNTLSHLELPLPAMTIIKPESRLAGIKTVLQEVKSFNGKPPEMIQQTKIRVGERLKHKMRAVTPWDYETLILEKFPKIYKVKCMPHMSSEKMEAPGHVLITVIEKVDKENFRIDYGPMVDNTTLHKIKSFVKKIASGFINIDVRNPVFERVQVRCAVKFDAGLDSGYFIDLLNKEIINFLTPWQTSGNNEPGFGKVIKCTDVLSFIQSLDFVDYATDFSMLQISHDTEIYYSLFDTANKSQNDLIEDTEEDESSSVQQKILKPTYPWGILISAEKHVIEIVDEVKEIKALKTGIDELEVGDTFIIK